MASEGAVSDGSVIQRWRANPAVMVRELFKVEPDPWQIEVLEAFPHKQRIALKAAKGVGKSILLSWLCWNFLLTRPFPNVAATSISLTNLRDGLWKEMARWRDAAPILQQNFTLTNHRIAHKKHPDTWFMAAKTYSQSADAEQVGKTLAGFHAPYVLFVLDESGGMPEAILPTAEAALPGKEESHIIQAGNPISLDGPLYRACVLARKFWYVVEITGDPDNPKRSPRIDIQFARDQIENYGRDNPWIRVGIFGEFPPANLNSLIGPEEVREAMGRVYREYDLRHASRILAVDVARYGDDASSLCFRQGLQVFNFHTERNLDSLAGGSLVHRKWTEFSPDAVFVDGTGGYGAGWIDHLRLLGRQAIDVQFSGKPHDTLRYANKRAEMYFSAVEWIRKGGALPNDPQLVEDLSKTTYTFQKDRLLLEPKELIKAKLGRSPDKGDSLAMTFAENVLPRPRSLAAPASQREWNPYAEADVDSSRGSTYGRRDFSPYGEGMS